MSNEIYVGLISHDFNLAAAFVRNTIKLLEEGATIPFIARYRKEMTGSMDEVVITDIRDRLNQLKELDARRETILKSITEQEKLTPELKKAIMDVTTIAELEDLYLPYKPKRKTKASIAREKGLEKLAKIIFEQQHNDIDSRANPFIDPEKGVNTINEAIDGACDIIAEWVNEDNHARKRIRHLYERDSKISAKVIKGKELEGQNYKIYFDFAEPLLTAPSHRVLAVLRGEKEGFLRVSVDVDEIRANDILKKVFIKSANRSAELVNKAIKDSCKRLLFPSMETEVRQAAKEKADYEAIKVFVDNLRQLLMAPPLGQKNILAIDPGFRSGCKVVCLDRQGNLIHNETIYPHPPSGEAKESIHKIKSLVNAYKIEAIAIGNGTAGRETERLIKSIPFEKDLIAIMVNESGASIYSASPIARKEFPDYDITVRGAVSIGRRLMDPLAELVKLDPKSIGVGQYQHDVNQNALQQSLQDTVVSCVNMVGVEVNTASEQLLTYVSGLGPSLAKNIIDHRYQNGPFKNRKDLKKISRFGDKAFEQAAGFLRIADGDNPLDISAVHPESYHVVAKMAKHLNCAVNELVGMPQLKSKLNPSDFVDAVTGLPTVIDILDELSKPGRDPRKEFEMFEFDKNIHSIHDLQTGMRLPGIVTNITNFGAFVDIGVHQDGLVHVSQLADKFVKDPNEVVKLNQKVFVTITEVDLERNRIQLSMKGVNTI